MINQFARVTMRKAVLNAVGDVTVMSGYIVEFEPEALAKREILRPAETNEPDTEYEVGYSKDITKPLTIVFQGREAKLTEKPFILCRYINDLYRTEERTEFGFAELSEILAGDDFKEINNVLEHSIRKIKKSLSEIRAPFSLKCSRETVYVTDIFGGEPADIFGGG